MRGRPGAPASGAGGFEWVNTALPNPKEKENEAKDPGSKPGFAIGGEVIYSANSNSIIPFISDVVVGSKPTGTNIFLWSCSSAEERVD